MDKSPDAFRTISEVADWLGIQAHVLRFWESKFTQVKPVKRAGGRRYYRPADMLLLGGIKKLLHEDGMTIKGVQKVLRGQGVATVSELSQALDDVAVSADRPRRAHTVVPFEQRGSVLDGRVSDQGQIELELGADGGPVRADDDDDMVIEGHFTDAPDTPPTFQARRPAAPMGPIDEAEAPAFATETEAPVQAPEGDAPIGPEGESPADVPAPETAADPVPVPSAEESDIARDPIPPSPFATEPEPDASEPAMATGQDDTADSPASESPMADTPDEDDAPAAALPTFRRHSLKPVASDSVTPPDTPVTDTPDSAPAPAPQDDAAATVPSDPVADSQPEHPAPEPEETSGDAPADPAPEAPRPRIVDAPDPPADDAVAAAPGVLSQLAALDRLSPDQHDEIAALAEALEALKAARAGQHAGQ